MKKIFIIILVLSLALIINRCGGGSGSSSPPADIPVTLEGIEGTSDVAVDSSFSYEFDSPVNTSTVNISTFFIHPTTPSSANLSSPDKAAYDETICDVNEALDSSVSCSSSTKCVLDPTDDLSAGTPHIVCISPNIEYANASRSFFIKEAFAAENFVGASFTFTTAGEAAIPDVSGVYSSDYDECVGNMVLAAQDTDNVYTMNNSSYTLTMTGANTCSMVATIEGQDLTSTCSYETNQFTIEISSPAVCTSILTKTDATCGDGICDYEDAETSENCPSECGVEVTSIAFLDDHDWATTSPPNDCLSVASGTDDFFFSESSSDEDPESYLAINFGQYYLRINRSDSNSCIVRFNLSPDDTYIDECIYVSACNTNQISATCELLAGDYCEIDLEEFVGGGMLAP